MWHALTLILTLALPGSPGLATAADAPAPVSPPPPAASPQPSGPPPPPADADSSRQPPQPVVQDLGNQRYRVGAIEIDKENRIFTVPGVVIRTDPPIEFVAVTLNGHKR